MIMEEELFSHFHCTEQCVLIRIDYRGYMWESTHGTLKMTEMHLKCWHFQNVRCNYYTVMIRPPESKNEQRDSETFAVLYVQG
jgi:hypothetical protein